MNGNGMNKTNGNLTNGMNYDKNALLEKLTAIDFAIHEAVLYLDGHPNNRKALEYYRGAVAERAGLYAAYADGYAPVRADDVRQDGWSWIDDPWPWQNGR